MKLISWNVNGLRACIKKGFWEVFSEWDADFVCLQETKIAKEDLEPLLTGHEKELDGYKVFYNCATKRKGYSGVLIFAKKTPAKEIIGIDVEDIDNEGRVLTLEYPDFYLVNAYFPHSDRELTRLKYKLYFNERFLDFVFALRKTKPKILTGDFNVAHEEIDIARPKQNKGNPGFTDIERTWFNSLLKLKFVDTFRELYPEVEKYTWWSYMHQARKKNIGWRIDYFLVSNQMLRKITSAGILNDVFGSDHCPITLEIN